MYICVYVYMYCVCMYVCVYICTYICVYVCVYVCTYVYMHVYVYVCTYTLCVHICTYISMHLCRMRKNSMSTLRELTEGTKTNIYFQGTVRRRRVLVALRTVKLGQAEAGSQAKPLKYSKEKLYFVPIYSRCSNVRPPISIHSQQRCSRD